MIHKIIKPVVIARTKEGVGVGVGGGGGGGGDDDDYIKLFPAIINLRPRLYT